MARNMDGGQSRWNKNGQQRWDITNIGVKKPKKSRARNKDGSLRKESRRKLTTRLKPQS